MKRILCICMTVAMFAAVIVSCQKECVCEKKYTADNDIHDTIAATTTTTMYSGGYDYTKRECESLSYTDTASTTITSFTCGLQDKK